MASYKSRDGVPLATNLTLGDPRLSLVSGTLSLSPLEADDSGEYRCHVNNRKRPNSVHRLMVQGKLRTELSCRHLPTSHSRGKFLDTLRFTI